MSAVSTRRILQNKAYLYLTEFFAGMSVMAVELGASRLLAPYFSSSQIVWTIIIGTIMIAMALGNIYGGKTADANPDPDRLYRRILAAAVWIAAIPLVGKYLILGISALLIFTVSQGFLIIAAFAACMVIFVFPLFLLGTVTPSLARYTTESLDESGRIVGRLGAANTIGSIIGTFAPTFVTIPAVGTAVTFLIFSGILLVLGIVYFLSPKGGKTDSQTGTKKDLRMPVICLILFLLCAVFGHGSSFAFWETGLTYEGESVYNYLQVKEDDRRVILSTNVLFGVQSVYEKTDSLTGMYYDYALAAPYMTADAAFLTGNAADEADAKPLSVLVLGNGSGTYATMCRRYFPDAVVEGVEIDAKITDLARRYFALPEDMDVTEYDGRAFLQAVDKTYDVIMVDAYQDITIPFQMSSVEFFTMVRDHLNDGGVMVVNMNMRGDGDDSINAYLADTIASVFDRVATADVPGATNRELYAVMGEEKDVAERLRLGAETEEDAQLSALMDRVYTGLAPYHGGSRILTDDKAPVELLGMRLIDRLIADEVAYYKGVYEEEGLEGLLNQL